MSYVNFLSTLSHLKKQTSQWPVTTATYFYWNRFRFTATVHESIKYFFWVSPLFSLCRHEMASTSLHTKGLRQKNTLQKDVKIYCHHNFPALMARTKDWKVICVGFPQGCFFLSWQKFPNLKLFYFPYEQHYVTCFFSSEPYMCRGSVMQSK